MERLFICQSSASQAKVFCHPDFRLPESKGKLSILEAAHLSKENSFFLKQLWNR